MRDMNSEDEREIDAGRPNFSNPDIDEEEMSLERNI